MDPALFVVGIDAGGTQTTALLANGEGEVLAQVKGPGANLQTHGELGVEKTLDDLIEQLGPPGRPAAFCIGMAGVDRPKDAELMNGILRRLGFRDNSRVVNDAAIALAAGSPTCRGIVVIAGTGSMAYGIDPAGTTARASGLGHVMADQGSSYWFGEQALRAAIKSSDGRGQKSLLEEGVLAALGATVVSDLVPVVYEQRLGTAEIADLAPLVEMAANEGDEAATLIRDQGILELRASAAAVHRQLDFQDGAVRFVMAGGAFKACPSVAFALTADPGFAHADPHLLDRSPAHGAVRLALELVLRARPQ